MFLLLFTEFSVKNLVKIFRSDRSNKRVLHPIFNILLLQVLLQVGLNKFEIISPENHNIFY